MKIFLLLILPFIIMADNIKIDRDVYINVPKELLIKKLLPYKYINDDCKIVGNMVKYRDNSGNIHIIEYNKLKDKYNNINNMLNDYIIAFQKYKKSNENKKFFNNCSTLVKYYPKNRFTCFKLMRELSEEDKIKLKKIIDLYIK